MRFALFLSTLCVAAFAFAQADPKEKEAALANFKDTHTKWEAIEKNLNAFDAKFRDAPFEEQIKLRDEYIRLVADARAFIPKLNAAAFAAYKAAPNEDKTVTTALLGVTADALHRDDYETAKANVDLLVASKCKEPGLNDLAGRTNYCTDNFAAAETFLKAAEAENAVSEEGLNFLADIPDAKERYAAEVEVRKAEAEANDLPRVKFETSKGVIVMELYENEAPQAVANFVSLVEKKFYDGLTFHRVIANFMAQGGDPKGNGTGGPGYHIKCECYEKNHRNHFRGTLSMAHAGRDTGGSQFFITFLRTPHLDGKHTAFGRVIEGMDVLTKLQRNPKDKTSADKIVKAEVLRKRDHKYEPTKLAE